DKQAHTDEALALLPTKYELSAPYPNPFNPSVVVPFALPENTKLRLVIFDILGREVVELADRNIQAGYHRVVWDGKNSAGIPVASGVYIVRLESDKFTAVKKAVMIK
ncbi:MAG: T9SS type A sorting domain-containing protein, partial [Candidatus Electryonea clarkiae]|nr:T9SS type A sorting domain-containing protein [Candidatus Electryonea clarkiae]